MFFGFALGLAMVAASPNAASMLDFLSPAQTILIAQAEAIETPDGGLANPSVGIGLAGVSDHSTQLPFLDLMKTARAWTGHIGDGWGGMEYDQLKEMGVLDDNGWPTRVPAEVSGISTLILTDLPSDTMGANGRYRLRYEGEGTLEITGADGTITARGGEAWFNNNAGPGAVVITIKETDPFGTGNYLRNFTIVKDDHIDAFEAGQIFNPDWIGRIKDMRTIRMMDWMATNDSNETDWALRPKPDDFTFGNHGVPLEIMIALANEIGADPWFNMPHLATDAYMRGFAIMVHEQLDPRLKAYVELSNEVWNWQFAQAQWAEQSGIARWGQESKWVQFYALRASEMADIWKEVFGDDAQERLVRVISTQTGWPGLEEDVLNAPMWTAEGHEPPYTHFDAYAITAYFSAKLGSDTAPKVMSWLDESRAKAEADARKLGEDVRAAYVDQHRYDLAVDRAARELRNGALTGDEEGSVKALLETSFPYHAEVARRYGLDLIMYEGGTHVVGSAEWVDNDELTAFFATLNYASQMGSLYSEMLAGWKAAGGGAFSLFVDVNAPSKWGSWGALRHLGDDNPRWNAIVDFNTETEAWWESRAPGTFDPAGN